MKSKKICLSLLILLLITSCSNNQNIEINIQSGKWQCGYATKEIEIPEEGKLYIAGYHQGSEIESIYDKQYATAMYLGNEESGTLLISVDCIALSKNYYDTIRSNLSQITTSINIFSTHTHAGIDTLGLWGNIAQEGKNELFMENLINACVEVGKSAYQNKTIGELFYSSIDTNDLQYDSRKPIVFDSNLYQFRFKSNQNQNSIRLINYAAHAESLRGDNYNLSSDYPGLIRKNIKDKTNDDDVIFIQGAIGGLIMTKELIEPFIPYKNLVLTANYLTDLILNIQTEEKLECNFKIVTSDFTTKLDNTLFMYYQFLGILKNDILAGKGTTGYSLKTRASIMQISNKLIYFVPGELFPELAYSSSVQLEDGSLDQLSNKKTLVFGLCNDEIGYIIPPSDYLLNEETPYFDTVKGLEENHYEETNSTSIDAWSDLFNCYKKLITMCD